MKKLLLTFICIFCLSGCFKRDSMENINIYTTIYPIEYITNRLYGDYYFQYLFNKIGGNRSFYKE